MALTVCHVRMQTIDVNHTDNETFIQYHKVRSCQGV